MLSCVLGITSPQNATVLSFGILISDKTPEFATLIITVGTQKITVMLLSRIYSGSFDGNINSVSGMMFISAPVNSIEYISKIELSK